MNNKLGVELRYCIIIFVGKNIFSCLQMWQTKVVILTLNVLLISSYNSRNYKLVLNGFFYALAEYLTLTKYTMHYIY